MSAKKSEKGPLFLIIVEVSKGEPLKPWQALAFEISFPCVWLHSSFRETGELELMENGKNVEKT